MTSSPGFFGSRQMRPFAQRWIKWPRHSSPSCGEGSAAVGVEVAGLSQPGVRGAMRQYLASVTPSVHARHFAVIALQHIRAGAAVVVVALV